MRSLSFIFLFFVSMLAFGQTQPNRPSGAVPYGSLWLAGGDVWSGSSVVGYTNLGKKAYVDSLFRAGYSKIQVDSIATAVRNRATHTGEQPISSITDLSGILANKANLSHTHNASDITSGVMDPARLGSGATGGDKVLHGDGTWKVGGGGGSDLPPGGTTNAFLKKASAADGDVKWEDVVGNDFGINSGGGLRVPYWNRENESWGHYMISLSASASTFPFRTGTGILRGATAVGNDDLVPLGQLNAGWVNTTGNQSNILGSKTWTGIQRVDNHIQINRTNLTNPTGFSFFTNGSRRWSIYQSPETGSDDGTLVFARYSDTEAFLGNVLYASRLTGGITLPSLGGNGSVMVTSNNNGLLSTTALPYTKSEVNALISGIPAGLELGETSSTAYRGDRGKTAYDYSQIGHIPLAQRAAANGVATLDGTTKIPIAQLPTGTTSSTVSLGNHTHSNATTSVPGFMSAADKTKLDGYDPSGFVRTTTNQTVDGVKTWNDRQQFEGGLQVPNDGVNNGIRLGAGTNSNIYSAPGSAIVIAANSSLFLETGAGANNQPVVIPSAKAPSGETYMMTINDAGNVSSQTIPSGGGGGSVSSVGLSMPTGFSVTNSPITTGGTIGVAYASGYQGYTTTEASKLSGITNFRLRSNSDAYLGGDVTLSAGSNVTLSQSGSTITISSTGGGGGGSTDLAQGTRTSTTVPITSSTGLPATLTAATTSLAGVMTATDKTKLDGIATGANNYTLPIATATVPGGVELFSNTVQSVAANAVTSTANRTYGVQLNSAGQAVVNVPWTDGGGGGSQDLEDVTDNGNTTGTNSIAVTGNADMASNATNIYYDNSSNEQGGIALTGTGTATGRGRVHWLHDSNGSSVEVSSGTKADVNPAQAATLKMYHLAYPGTNGGRADFNVRVSGVDAQNANEFVTKSQLDAATGGGNDNVNVYTQAVNFSSENEIPLHENLKLVIGTNSTGTSCDLSLYNGNLSSLYLSWGGGAYIEFEQDFYINVGFNGDGYYNYTQSGALLSNVIPSQGGRFWVNISDGVSLDLRLLVDLNLNDVKSEYTVRVEKVYEGEVM